MTFHTRVISSMTAALFLLSLNARPAQTAGKQKSAAGGAEEAAAVFKRQCAGCHGADGAGQTAMGKAFKIRDLRSQEVQSMTDAQLFDVIAKGKGKMPAYENNLGHDRIHALIAYLRGLSKSKQ